MIVAIVAGQGVFLAVQGKAPSPNAVCKPTHHSAQIFLLDTVVLQIVKPQHNIVQLAICTGHLQGPDGSTVCENLAHSIPGTQCNHPHRVAIWHRTKLFLCILIHLYILRPIFKI